MRQVKLKTAMIVVAVLGIGFGVGLRLRQRSQRFDDLALQYGSVANRLENLLNVPKTGTRQINMIVDLVHWHDAVANQYRKAAARPWLPFDPDPSQVECDCGYHANLRSQPPKQPSSDRST